MPSAHSSNGANQQDSGPSIRPSQFGDTDEPGAPEGGIQGDLHTGGPIGKRKSPRRRPTGANADSAQVTEEEMATRLAALDLDMSSFYVPARDAHGHTERFQFFILHGDLVEAQAIASSRLWPYESLSALIRHAVRRHVQWLNETQPRPSMIGQVLILNEVLRADKYNADFTSTFDEVSGALDRYKKMRRVDMAEALLHKVKAHVDGMPDEGDEGNWKARYQQRMVEEWAQEFPAVFQVDSGTVDADSGLRILNGGAL